MARKLINIGAVVLFVLGFCILTYPMFSNWWNMRHQSRAVGTYIEQVEDMSVKQKEQMREDAIAYNTELAKSSMHFQLSSYEAEQYNKTLDVTGTGIMGYVDIPRVDIKLPIYHGTDEAILQIAAGHITGTSLPVGGESTHCVISGHSGLPSAKLFTDIVKLEMGDTFTLNVLDDVLTYEVDQIRVVLPNELEDLKIQKDEDFCTLVTCTPYGINTHRLLVRGRRTTTIEGNIPQEAFQVNTRVVAIILTLIIVFFTLLLFDQDGGIRMRWLYAIFDFTDWIREKVLDIFRRKK